MKTLPLRIVPALLIAAVPLLGLKLFGIIGEIASFAVQPAQASSPNPPPAATPAASTPASAPSPATPAPAGTATAVAAPNPPPASGEPKDVGAKGSAGHASGRDPASYSPAEVELLQALAQRRDELDKRGEELDGREMMLKAAEQRIAEKIDDLKKMEKSIDDKLQQKDEENEAKIKNLVKIYEIMKPPEAARIFEQLDMPVLLDVVEHMKEAKAAPILANMKPEKAKALTLALADRRQAPKP